MPTLPTTTAFLVSDAEHAVRALSNATLHQSIAIDGSTLASLDFMQSISLGASNLVSVPVLAFALGALAAFLRADLRLPDAAYQAISIYLLLAIGIKGGVELRNSQASEVIAPLLVAILLGISIPIAAFFLLRVVTPLGVVDRGAMAAHYGSTSLVTFTAAVVFSDSADVPYEGFMATVLAVMEVPGIVVALLLVSRSSNTNVRMVEALREVITSRSILLLAGGLLIGFFAGTKGYAKVEPFFGSLFQGVLALFLLELGVIAGMRIAEVRKAGVGLVVFAIGFPLLAGGAGVIAGTGAGLSIGGATVLGVLCASASYIAAPAAVKLALPEANSGITILSSLGITFPFNLLIGTPLYFTLASALG